jgi:hypothetical protein
MNNVLLTTLSSGLRCAIYTTTSPVSYCALSTLGGTRFEPQGFAGLAHFCEHMLFKGTEKRSAYHINNQELVQRQVEQSRQDFEQDIILNVRQFNMQGQQFLIAAKADTIAQKRYDVAKQRYLIDKITVTDMNNAQLDRDEARVGFVQALFNYWRYYYELRALAQFDFINNSRLDADYEALVD